MPRESTTTGTARPATAFLIMYTVLIVALVLVATLVFSGCSTSTTHLKTRHPSTANTQGGPMGTKTQSPTQPIILLTGFEPFGGRTINASWEAVRQLNGMVIDGASVQSEELPVLWHGSAEKMTGFIQTYKPVLVVSAGEGGPILSLEKYAHNHNDSAPDNAGKLPESSSIISNAPSRFATPLDIAEMSNALTKEGVQNVVSSDAGGYLCNFISFNTYAYLNKTQSHIPTLFVHVPPTSSSGDQTNISMIAKALTIILQQSMNQVAQPHA